jgi:hypothetical protein
MRSFFEDFYSQVYFLPGSLDFGAITAEATRSVIVWNAHLNNTGLTGISITNGSGTELLGPGTPYDFLPLEVVSYEVVVQTSGPPTLAASIQFSFDTPETYVLNVSGRRSKVSPFTPNWRKAYQIDYQFKTDIFTSRSGKEQRRALRTSPRKTISFEATPTGDQVRRFRELMASWHNNVIVLPEIPRQSSLSAPLLAGDVLVSLPEDAPSWAIAGESVILAHRGRYETRLISTVSGAQITLAGVSALDWPAGTKIHPMVSGRLAASIGGNMATNTAAIVPVEMEVTPGSETVLPIPPAPSVFNGRELFTMKPNWSSLPDVTHEAYRDEVDFGHGRTAIFTPVNFNTQIRQLTFTSKSYSEMGSIRENFERMRGQRGEFYMDTGEPDVLPGTLSPAGTNSIRVAGPDFAEAYAGSSVHRAVAVHFRDGTVQRNVVSDIYEVDDADGLDSVLQVVDTWAQDVSQSNVKMVSWLLVWRHATDTLTIEWLTDTVGRCQLTLRSLEDLP